MDCAEELQDEGTSVQPEFQVTEGSLRFTATAFDEEGVGTAEKVVLEREGPTPAYVTEAGPKVRSATGLDDVLVPPPPPEHDPSLSHVCPGATLTMFLSLSQWPTMEALTAAKVVGRTWYVAKNRTPAAERSVTAIVSTLRTTALRAGAEIARDAGKPKFV